MKFLVTGATGNIGAAVAAQLAAAGHQVGGLVRETSATALPDGVEQVAGDLNRPDTVVGALDGVDGLFLLPGYEGAGAVLVAARDRGVRHVVQLSGVSAQTGDKDNAVTAYMVAAEETVERSGVPYTVLRPAAFMTNALRWLPQLRAGEVLRVPFPDVAVAAIDPDDIAAVTVAAFVEDGHAGATYRLSGPEPLRPADQVATLGRVLGRDLRFVGLSDEEARAELEAAMPKPYVDAFFDFYVDGAIDESLVLPTVEEITGRPPGTFADWAARHVDAFQ